MERFPKLESLISRLFLALVAAVSSTQLALADSNAPPGSQILPGAYQSTQLIAQQSGWPNTPPQWQSTPGTTSSMPAPPPQNPNYQSQLVLPSNDSNPYGTSVPSSQQAPMQGYTQVQQQQQIQPGQLQGYPVSQQAPGQLPQQAYGGVQQQGYPQQQPQYAPQPDPNTQYGQAQQTAAPSSPPGWSADYPTQNDAGNTASQVPMDTAQPAKAGIGSKLGKALGGVAKMAGPVAGMGMAGMTAATMGRMMNGGYGMGGMGMGGMGMSGMGMGGYGMPMGGMGMGGMGMGGMGMGGYGMPMGGMGMGGMGMGGMGMGQNMMMNSVLNQGLRMLQR